VHIALKFRVELARESEQLLTVKRNKKKREKEEEKERRKKAK